MIQNLGEKITNKNDITFRLLTMQINDMALVLKYLLISPTIQNRFFVSLATDFINPDLAGSSSKAFNFFGTESENE